MNRARIVDYYLEKVDGKNFDLFDARKEMEKNQVDEQEIKTIIRLLDNELQRKMIYEAQRKQANAIFWIGVVVSSIGAVITLGTFFGFIPMGNSFLLAYGPFFSGLAIMFSGLAKKRRR